MNELTTCHSANVSCDLAADVFTNDRARIRSLGTFAWYICFSEVRVLSTSLRTKEIKSSLKMSYITPLLSKLNCTVVSNFINFQKKKKKKKKKKKPNTQTFE